MAGYIGTTPVPQATQHRESFTATGGQTSFATVGYTPQFIDVYLNGVKLAPADYTATNGSDVVLASGATASDILEIVAYTPFEVANQTFTGTTTAANLTVTGAFTSQGIDDNADAVAITIDSSENVGIGTSSPSGKLSISGATATNEQVHATFTNTSGAKTFAIGAGQSGVTNNGFVIRNVTDNTFPLVISDAGVTSFGAGNVGIGTTSPSSYYANHLVVDTGSSAQSGITIVSDTSNQGMFAFADGTSGDQRYRGAIDYNHSNDSMAFLAAGSERMRLDSSGNLLVGKTTIATGTAGVALRSNGEVRGTVSGAEAARFSRLSSDGAIVGFEKDGTSVGGLSVFNSHIGLFQGGTRLEIDDGNDAVFFTNNSVGGFRDGTTDIGKTNARIKDLYLSGGVFLGGTGSANQLDNYEDGSWTVNLYKGGSALAVTNRYGYYRRVGDLLHISFYWYNSNLTTTGTNVYSIRGMPFNLIALANAAYQFCPVGYNSIDSNNVHRWQANSLTELNMYGSASATNVSSSALEFSGTGVFRI